MIDSGATQCFINQSLVDKLDISTTKLRDPIYLDVADGRPIESGAITQQTSNVSMSVRMHHESINFLVTNIGSHSLILGTTWLKKHNPLINWTERTIHFNSGFCGKTCLQTSCKRVPPQPGTWKPSRLPKDTQIPASAPKAVVESHNQECTPSVLESHSQECTPSVFESHIQECTPPVLGSYSQEYTPSAALPLPTPEISIGSIGMRTLQNLIKKRQVASIVALDLATGEKQSLSTLDGHPIADPTTSVNPEIPEELRDYADVFSKSSAEQLPEHSTYDHTIPLEPGTKPPYGPIYSLSATELKALDEYLKENLAKGFIRPSSSPAGSPILFVKKSDGSLRLCVDYRGLNKITVKNRYPLPLIQENLDRLSNAKYFTKIDLRGAYNLIRIAAGEEWKTAFRTRYGLFEYLVMPFGLTNAPASFQQLMNEVLREYLDISVIVYLDDILIYSKTREEHVQHIKKVLERLRQHRLWAKAEKCRFFQSSVDFLGYIVSQDGVSMDPSKVKSILDWQAPKSVKDIQVFLGFANFYRRFIKKYSKLTEPLTRLLRKDVKFDWSDSANTAFESLKKAFTTAPILTHFDPARNIILETDASDYALAGVLSHPDPHGNLQPIAFYSRKFNDAELNYEIYDKELLAIIQCLKEWRAYCEGSSQKITIYSDHKNLEYFSTSKVLTRRQARWMEFLSHFDFEIIYRKGSLMAKPDALTRRSELQGGSKASEAAPKALLQPDQLKLDPVLHSVPANSFEIADLHQGDPESPSLFSNIAYRITQGQASDEKLAPILKLLKTPEEPQSPDQLVQTRGFTLAENDLLYYNNRISIPDDDALKLEILQQCHGTPLAGHLGRAKTFALVSRHYFWPGMRAYVNTYVSGCQTCQRNKTPRHKPVGLLQPLPIPTGPWRSISVDAIVKLPESNDFDSIMVIVCRLTKMAHFLPFKEEGFTSEHLAKMFRSIFRLHGIPEDIVSDRGPIFTSKFWRSFASGLGIKLNFSTAYHPQSDGQTERVNQVLEQYLRMFVNYRQDNWVELLDTAEFTYNNTEHASTKVTPFFANYGYHPCDPSTPVPQQHNPSAQGHLEEIFKLRTTLQENIAKAQAESSKYYNRKVKSHLNLSDTPLYSIGDKVWLNARNMTTSRPSAKLDHKLLGPFKVVEKISDLVFRLDLPPTMEINNSFHISQLEPFNEGQPGQVQQEPPPILVSGEQQYVPERILNGRFNEDTNQYEYLVHWEGYPDSEDTWEPFDELNHLKVFKRFLRDNRDNPSIFPSKLNKSATRKNANNSRSQS